MCRVSSIVTAGCSVGNFAAVIARRLHFAKLALAVEVELHRQHSIDGFAELEWLVEGRSFAIAVKL